MHALRIVKLGCLGLLFGYCTVAAAEGSLLDRGKALLQNLTGNSAAQSLPVSDIEAGLREALKVGTRNVVKRVGAADGFNKDPAIHIPLPESLQSVQSALGKVGMGGMLDDVELKLNRAAEAAAPKARRLFVDAIAEMTVEDARRIYDGPDDAATRYFQGKMTPQLAQAMRPVVDSSLAEVGAIQSYDAAMGKYRGLPFVPDVKADLSDYVVGKGMDGIFHYLAVEEAQIRKDPAKRTTELLQRVFAR
jgi:hypothetical protein